MHPIYSPLLPNSATNNRDAVHDPVGSHSDTPSSPSDSFHKSSFVTIIPDAVSQPQTPSVPSSFRPFSKQERFPTNDPKFDADDMKVWHHMLKSGSGDAMRHMSEQQLLSKPTPPLEAKGVVTWPWKFLENNIQASKEWFKECNSEIKKSNKLLILALKAGVAATLLSVMCVLDDPFDSFQSIGVWAVVTADLLFESNVGLCFSKGINRTAGTLVAGIIALAVNKSGPYMGAFYPYFVVIWVFLGGLVPTFYRFRPPFKDKWNYAVVMSQLTFHILILSGYNSTTENGSLILPIARFGMIILGFVVVIIIVLSVKPSYAGDSLHSLVSKNFNTAAQLLKRCVCEYHEGTVLDHIPNISKGLSKLDDKIYVLYHEVVMSGTEVNKLLSAVNFEPGHGKFVHGYPWHRYELISDFLRYVVYDIIGLDSCLRGEIQAPINFRSIFSQEINEISQHCVETLKLIAVGIQDMKWVDCYIELGKAEEGALKLQHKIGKELPFVLMGFNLTSVASEPSLSEDKLMQVGKKSNLPTISSDLELFKLPENATEETSKWRKIRAMKRSEMMERNESMRRQWESTSKRIAALSFVKFASLLLEIVAKMNFVIEAFNDLAADAKFEGSPIRVHFNS